MAVSTASKQHRSPNSGALGIRFLLLAILSVVLLVLDHRVNHLDAVRKAVSAAVYPLRVVVDAPGSIWSWIRDTTADRGELQIENSRLNAERLLTRARLQRYAALEAENRRLRALLDATGRVRDQVRVAEIMSVSSNPFRQALVIDKGTRAGVYEGQAIVDADGVVGQIIEAGVLSSQGILISDPDHALPVEVNRNGLRTIAVGTGELDHLDLPFLPNNADIQLGDLLVTSGLGGAFPAGYPVATVESVVRIPQEPFAAVSATPSAALNQVREVMLIWSTNDAERDEAEQPAIDESRSSEDAAAIQEATEREAGTDLPEADLAEVDLKEIGDE